MSSGVAAPSQSQENQDFNQADAILWQNMVTLPLYQEPVFWARSNNLKGVLPNTSSTGVTWNSPRTGPSAPNGSGPIGRGRGFVGPRLQSPPSGCRARTCCR